MNQPDQDPMPEDWKIDPPTTGIRSFPHASEVTKFTGLDLPPLDLSPEELDRLKQMKTEQDELVQDYQAAIERALVGNLEVLLGRVPGHKEIAKHGKAELDPEGNMVFSWKGKPFMTAAPLAPLAVPNDSIAG